MIVRKLRLERNWTQEQLAEMCGVSVRTIQRLERGQKPSLETVNALSAVFDLDLHSLHQEPEMQKQLISTEEEHALIYVRDIKGFYSHLIKYVLVIGAFFVLNIFRSPNNIWAIWPALGWGIGVVVHGLNVFEVFHFFGPDWERRQLEKRMNRKG